MSDFFTWFAGTLATWWTFLSTTMVPGTQFTFGTLYLFLIAFPVIIAIIRMAMKNKIKDKE